MKQGVFIFCEFIKSLTREQHYGRLQVHIQLIEIEIIDRHAEFLYITYG